MSDSTRCREPAPWLALASILSSLALTPTTGDAQWRFSGAMGAQARAFPQAPRHKGQDRHAASFFAAPELSFDVGGRHSLVLAPFMRVLSDRRSDPVLYLRELAWTSAFGRWSTTAGIHRVQWGVVRSKGPANVLSQRDRSSHPFSDSRMGQPLIEVVTTADGGSSLQVLAMTRMPVRPHASRSARLRGAAWVDPSRVEYSVGSSRSLEIAARWTARSGGALVALSGFSGMGRDPQYVTRSVEGEAVKVSQYRSLRQAAFELQYADPDWTVTAESALRAPAAAPRHVVSVLGLTRVVSHQGVRGSVTIEYIRDSAGQESSSIKNDDIYLEAAARMGEDTPLQASLKLLVDRRNQSMVWTAEASHSLGQQWWLGVSTWAFSGDDFAAFRADGYFQLSIVRRF